MNTDILELYVGLAVMDPKNRGNEGAAFPIDDAADFTKGVRFVPGEVTVARRRGERVVLYQNCTNPCCWYWQMSNGSRIYHFERWAYEQIAEANSVELEKTECGSKTGNPGPCPQCGNSHTMGGVFNDKN